jgi:1-pyrroline-5-carboxylate dehydrogenase
MQFDAVTSPPVPVNEANRLYLSGSAETAALRRALDQQRGVQVELTCTIDGVQRRGSGDALTLVEPHAHERVLATTWQAGTADVSDAVDASLRAAAGWRSLPFDERAAVLLKAAELLSGPWRDRLNAATMLGQSKTCFQAEIDSACELADFWRFNVHFARQLLAEQPAVSPPGVWNRTDHRPLEGFVLAITPFNFTAIAGNLPTAPALMGNTVVWKPSPAQGLAAHLTMLLLQEAGLPPGVINLVTGDGAAVSQVAVGHRDLAGIHFTGSTSTFRGLWRAVAGSLDGYRSYPRLVGETGGKDFVVAHPSAEPMGLVTAMVRGAFEYQGQKCSAASRAYVPRSLWDGGVRDALVSAVEQVTYGDVTDWNVFGGAVIDRRSFDRLQAVQQRHREHVLVGGEAQGEQGFFVQPSVFTGDGTGELFDTEHFGPLLAVHVWDDSRPGSWAQVLDLVDGTSPYALTGAVWATDRTVLADALTRLRFAAGNVYVNDKPTGAVVGQQPFGGARASGTDDKAGSALNLLRWTAPRSIKETWSAPRQWRHPHQGS